MTERQLADNICRVHAKMLVDDNGGITVGGDGLAELYMNAFGVMTGSLQVYAYADAIRHWVESAGYDDDGKFKYIISNYIQNC